MTYFEVTFASKSAITVTRVSLCLDASKFCQASHNTNCNCTDELQGNDFKNKPPTTNMQISNDTVDETKDESQSLLIIRI